MFAASKTAGAVSAAPPASSDPQFNYVSLLLNDTGTNGQQNNTFLDSSTNNFTITRNGTPTQGSVTPYWPEGQWSNYFSGSNTFLSASANTAFVLDGSFTVEAWVFLTATPANDADGKARANICNYYQSGSTSSYQLHINKTDNLIFFGRNQSGVGITGSFNVPLNTWVHIAAVYNGTTGAIYVNGTSVTLTTNNWAWVAPSTPTFRVGALTQSSYTHYFPGYISNLRIVKGTALYTSNFTPSTTPLTAVSGTSLLTCQSNRFKDNSSNNFAITVTGTPTVQAFEPFEPASSYATSVGGSAYFGGVSDWMTIPANTATNVLGGDFTIEAWVFPNAFNAYNFIAMQDDGNSGSQNFQLLYTSAGLVKFTTWSTSSRGSFWEILSTAALTRNAWNHVAVTRSGTTTRLFLNGVQQVSSTNTVWAGASIQTGIGNWSAGSNQTTTYSKLNGYVSNLRIVKGTAVYTAAFTPPTSPVTAITGTSLLLNCTNAGIYDAATLNDLVTVGNAQVSTAQAKFGSSSMAFDGSGDYLTAISSDRFSFGTGDFTVEAWVNFGSLGGANYAPVFSNAYLFYVGSAGQMLVFNGSSNVATGTNGAVTTNTWTHLAWCRSGTSLRMFVNGVQTGSTATVSASIGSASPNLVGRYSTVDLQGYMEDLRITKGYARYTSNFSVPTAPFPTR